MEEVCGLHLVRRKFAVLFGSWSSRLSNVSYEVNVLRGGLPTKKQVLPRWSSLDLLGIAFS